MSLPSGPGPAATPAPSPAPALSPAGPAPSGDPGRGYRRLADTVLFRLGGGDAESAHETTLRALARLARRPALLRALHRRYGVAAPTEVFGVRFPNPVGLAAGLDKDGRALPVWPALGFGFTEVGTVTRHAQPGNDRPRLFRLTGSDAIINRMGFNNRGAAALADRLAALGPLPTPLGISLGKSKATPLDDAVGDYLSSLELLRPYADYLAVNVSSPNTPGLRSLQDRAQLAELLGALRAAAGATPILVKIAPDLTEHAIGEVLEVCAHTGVAGLIATNTTIGRDGLSAADAGRAGETGGLSGRPLTERARQVVTFITQRSPFPVIGVGGIVDPDDADRMFDAGASLVQLYTGLIYRGPDLIRAVATRAARRAAADPPTDPGSAPGYRPELRPEEPSGGRRRFWPGGRVRFWPGGRVRFWPGGRVRRGGRLMVPPVATAAEPTGLSAQRLLALDRAHVWHPYAPMPGQREPYLVESASGVRLRLADGRELVDGMSSWWAAIHGYRHPVLDAAVTDQLGRMSHVMFGGLTHEPAIRLAATLVELTGLDHVFLCDSGSVSVEVALKMCLQYWRSRGRPAKQRALTWRGGYHGDTFHPMSVCDPDGGMHSLWRGVLPEQVFVPEPPAGFDTPVDPAYVELLSDAIARHADELACVIVEPVVQGAGGMRFHHPGYLRVLRELCDTHGVLLVFDEIATGFGRSGAFFAAEHAGVLPDVMCLGKALTGGYLSLAAALCTAAVADGISSGELPVLAHGPTFMGNPLACAVANASLSLLTGPSAAGSWRGEVARIEAALIAGLAVAGACRGSGTCGCSARSGCSNSITRSRSGRRPLPRSPRVSGCDRSVTLCTRCRLTLSLTMT